MDNQTDTTAAATASAEPIAAVTTQAPPAEEAVDPAPVAQADPAPTQAPAEEQHDSGDETAAVEAAPKTHLDYSELDASLKASVDHARGLFAKLRDVFKRVEKEGIDEAHRGLNAVEKFFHDVAMKL